jgi:type I restriction enzyme R subunit
LLVTYHGQVQSSILRYIIWSKQVVTMTVFHNAQLVEVENAWRRAPKGTVLLFRGAVADIDGVMAYTFNRPIVVSGLSPLDDPPLVGLQIAGADAMWMAAPIDDYEFELTTAGSSAAQRATALEQDELPADIQLALEQDSAATLRPEAWTRHNLIDPVLSAKGWVGDKIKREHTFYYDYEQKEKQFRADYVLRVYHRKYGMVTAAIIEAKRESFTADYGLEQGKVYADALAQNVRYVYSTNGHEFVQFDRTRQVVSDPQPMANFPKLAVLQDAIQRIPDAEWRIDKDALKLTEHIRATHQTLDPDRETDVRKIAELLLPRLDVRAQTFEFFSDALLFAHGIGPGKWVTTLSRYGDFVKLIVGPIEVLIIIRGIIYIVLDEDTLSEQDIYELGKYGVFGGTYRKVESSLSYQFRADMLPIVAPLFMASFNSLQELAASKSRTAVYKRYHAAGVVDYLKSTIGPHIPHPIYG